MFQSSDQFILYLKTISLTIKLFILFYCINRQNKRCVFYLDESSFKENQVCKWAAYISCFPYCSELCTKSYSYIFKHTAVLCQYVSHDVGCLCEVCTFYLKAAHFLVIVKTLDKPLSFSSNHFSLLILVSHSFLLSACFIEQDWPFDKASKDSSQQEMKDYFIKLCLIAFLIGD